MVLLLLLLLEELLLQLLVLMLMMAVVVGRASVDHASGCVSRMDGIGGAVHAVGVFQLFEIFPSIPDVDQGCFRGNGRIRHDHHDVRVAGKRVDEGREYAVPHFHGGKLGPQLRAGQFELFDDVGHLLEPMAVPVLLPLTV